MQEAMIRRALELLADGTVDRVAGWKKGLFVYDITPAVFRSAEDLKKNFVYNEFCGGNLSKYLVRESAKGGKTLAFLKPCDTYSFNQLVSEHRIARDSVYVVGVECGGKAGIEKAREAGITGITGISASGDELVFETLSGEKRAKTADLLDERCVNCKSKKHAAYDELIGTDGAVLESGRFDMVEKLEKMSSGERFRFWQNELSRCIRCNACRDVCPACTCEKCVFDNPKSGAANKAAADSFEESMFHIIRAYHVAGRCTDCGECSRVCPEHIPLHLLNRKFIKDIDSLYGEYQAGETVNENGPMVDYTEKDAEPSAVSRGGAGK